MKTYIGIDNGVTGSIAIIKEGICTVYPMPIKKELSYTKAKQKITRIDFMNLVRVLKVMANPPNPYILCMIERPMVNPTRFKSSASALRSLEATLIALETLGLPYQYIDSKSWQKMFIQHGISGSELKPAAVDVAKRLFPDIVVKDADSILIAEYARRMNL